MLDRVGVWALVRASVGEGEEMLDGLLGGWESQARGVSSDGSAVVGWAIDGNGRQRVFRWTESGASRSDVVLTLTAHASSRRAPQQAEHEQRLPYFLTAPKVYSYRIGL